LLSRDYAYLAFRWSNPAFLEHAGLSSPSFALRSLSSLSEKSTSLLASFEGGLNARFTLAIFGIVGLGPADRELRQVYDRLLGVALKASF
jgi:hypothetical protein